MARVTIEKLDAKHFPIICCGTLYSNCRTFMDHFLPIHERDGLPLLGWDSNLPKWRWS